MIAGHMHKQADSEGSIGRLAYKPKLLFLACYFPPVRAIGAVRTGNIARYLARLGWEVTVVTPHSYVWRTVEDSERISRELEEEGIHRILTDHRWRCLEPVHLKCWDQNVGWIAGGICRTIARRLGLDKNIGWIKDAERACSNLSPKDVDVILASGKPFVAFRLARSLSNRLGRPYMLDYRDPWTANPHAGRPPRPAIIREEASLLQGCAAVTVVSPSWGADLDRRFGVGAKLHVVPNGYDSGEMAAVKPHDFGHCAIVYTGIFYPPRRVISPFLAALKHLKESLNETSNEWYFHYYGAQGDHVHEEAVRFGLSDRIVLHGKVPRHEALSAVKGASLAVVVVSVEEQASSEMLGMVPAKIFEAIGLGTPVLLIAPLGSDATALLARTGLVKSFTGAETQGMASFLKDVVCGQVLQLRNIEICSWATISKNLDALLRRSMTSQSYHQDMRDGNGAWDGSNEPKPAS
ncbi:MAG: glycosyltransferase [Nitrospira sp.]|nr:glycosyltransferase [Nitrospira sp.]